jgi:hypothetical protein
MSLQEIHKIPLTYSHWANRIDDRDWEVIGIRKTVVEVNEHPVNLFRFLDQDALARVGFIRRLWLYNDGWIDTYFQIMTARGVYDASNRTHGTYVAEYHINSPTCSIIAETTSLNPLTYYMWFEYLPKKKYLHYSLGQDSLSNAGPAAGIDIPAKKTIKI